MVKRIRDCFNMWENKRFLNPTAVGGYGTIIVTLIIFFAQGGFGKMTPLTALYIIGLIIGFGLILYGVVHQPKEKYVDKLIADFKTPKLMEITKVLWQKSRLEAAKTKEKLNAEVSAGKMQNIRNELGSRFKIQAIYESTNKKEMIRKTVKTMRQLGIRKLSLLTKELDIDEYVNFSLNIAWALNNHKVGLSTDLNNDADYSALETKLDELKLTISTEDAKDGIVAFNGFSLGTNSLYLFTHWIPNKHQYEKVLDLGYEVGFEEFESARDKYLEEIRLYVEKSIEEELRGKTN